ncbi:MFS transporter [Halovulum sp. GXIMD14793]
MVAVINSPLANRKTDLPKAILCARKDGRRTGRKERPHMTDTSPRSSLWRARMVPLIVATALLMETLDATVLSTSLPQIALDLGADPIHLKLALTSYLLALAVFIPASGWAADRYGARLVFRLAILVFAAGSIACAMSSTLGHLVVARVLQGMGGAMMVPVGRLIVLRATPKAELVNALAWLTIPALIGPVLGPPLGGFITTFFDWRWIFWINIPIAALGLVLVTLHIPDIRVDGVGRFDLGGFLLLGPGLAAALTGVTLLSVDIAPLSLSWALTLGGLILLAFYVRHALRHAAPIIDLRLMRLPTFRASVTGGTMFRVGSGALPFLLPLLLQLGFGLSAFQSGMMTFAAGAGAMMMKFFAPPLLRRFGFRKVLLVNAVLSAASLATPAAFTPQTPWLVMLLVLFIGGLCRSLQFTALHAVAYAEVSSDSLSSATSFSSVLQQLSWSLGITLAAFGLEAMQALTGADTILQGHFPAVFLLMAALPLISVIFFARLSRSAGAEMLD